MQQYGACYLSVTGGAAAMETLQIEEIERVYSEFRANRGATHQLNERPNMAIVDWAAVPTSTEFCNLIPIWPEPGNFSST